MKNADSFSASFKFCLVVLKMSWKLIMADNRRVLSDSETNFLKSIEDLRNKRIRPDRSKIQQYMQKRFALDTIIVDKVLDVLEREGVIYYKTKKSGTSYYINKKLNLIYPEEVTNTSKSNSKINNVNEAICNESVVTDMPHTHSIINDNICQQ